MLDFTWWQTTVLLIAIIGGLSVLAATFLIKPKVQRVATQQEEAEKESTLTKLYTSDIQRGTQHWPLTPTTHVYEDGHVDITPEIHQALMDVGWIPDITDPSLLKLTPANEALGATEEWSPLAAIEAQDDFVTESAAQEVIAVPIRRDHYAMREMLEDAWWDQAFAILDDELEMLCRRCDAAVDAINPGGLRQLALAAA